MHVEKNGSDEISDGNQIGSDTFQNGSDIIRYPTAILSPDFVHDSSIPWEEYLKSIYKFSHLLIRGLIKRLCLD